MYIHIVYDVVNDVVYDVVYDVVNFPDTIGANLAGCKMVGVSAG
jgi:hypothetical protein